MTLLAGVGYFAVWAALGAALFALGATLAALEMQMPAVSRAVPVVAGVIVLGAGALQLTAWKAHYLRCCRHAAPYRFMHCRRARLPRCNTVCAWVSIAVSAVRA